VTKILETMFFDPLEMSFGLLQALPDFFPPIWFQPFSYRLI